MSKSRAPVIYLPEVPWLARLIDPVSDETGAVYDPCPLCDSLSPLIEDATRDGSMFICLVDHGGCGQRFYVDNN